MVNNDLTARIIISVKNWILNTISGITPLAFNWPELANYRLELSLKSGTFGAREVYGTVNDDQWWITVFVAKTMGRMIFWSQWLMMLDRWCWLVHDGPGGPGYPSIQQPKIPAVLGPGDANRSWIVVIWKHAASPLQAWPCCQAPRKAPMIRAQVEHLRMSIT